MKKRLQQQPLFPLLCLDFCPKLRYDAMVMTRDCENTELAYEFMDFMLRDDVAYSTDIMIDCMLNSPL